MLGQRPLQHLDALLLLARPVQRVPERQRRLGLPLGIAHERQGVAEVRDHRRRADVRLDARQLEQQLAALLACKRLLERARQVARGALQSPSPAACSAAASRSNSTARGTLSGGASSSCAATCSGGARQLGEDLGGSGVLGLALLRRDALVDRVADERVDERERRLRPQQIDAGQRGRRRRDLAAARAPASAAACSRSAAVAEHGHRTRESRRFRGSRPSRRRTERVNGVGREPLDDRRPRQRPAPRPRRRASAAARAASSGLPPVAR